MTMCQLRYDDDAPDRPDALIMNSRNDDKAGVI